MKHHQHIAELGSLLISRGIKHVIICPGSRNAPLIQLFTSRSAFQCYSIVDERSAGYIALGMARQLQEPVVVLTTSGTAVLNLAPAVAEAYHQRVPLLVITADRPPEKFSIFNNQIIDQQAAFYAYSKGFYQVPINIGHPEDLSQVLGRMERLVSSILRFPAGPVHINIPLEEPLYDLLPGALEKFIQEPEEAQEDHPVPDFGAVDNNTKILVLAGMGQPDSDYKEVLSSLSGFSQCVVIAENIANLPGEKFISQPDLLLFGIEKEARAALIPDLLLSFGGQVVSKQLKLFLQKQPDLRHVDINGAVKASLESLTELLKKGGGAQSSSGFREVWKQEEEFARADAQEKLKSLEYGNLWAAHALLSSAPSGSIIHLGNSSTIRYSQILPRREDLTYYSNRGTSGIDGCVSSAVGAALVSEQTNILLVGDLSFVYDSNALWNSRFPDNLKIVVLNDGGGGIFRLLKGPSKMDFFEEYSVSHHPASPVRLAQSFDRKAMRVETKEELEGAIGMLLSPGSSLSVLDVDTSEQENSRIFKEFLDIKH